MRSDTLSEYFSVTLTKQEKELLRRLAEERGATMRGYIRKLIRDAGSRFTAHAHTGHDSDRTSEVRAVEENDAEN